MKTAIIYGTTTGNTEEVAKKVAAYIEADIFDICLLSPKEVEEYELIILAAPTWGSGELSMEWESDIKKIEKINFSNKMIAYIGVGDGVSYSDTFCSIEVTNGVSGTIRLFTVADIIDFAFTLQRANV